MTKSFLLFLQSNKMPSMADENWWLAFVPIVVVAIIFAVIYYGFRGILRGNKFLARLFRLSEEEHADLIRRSYEKSKELALKERQKLESQQNNS